MAASISTSLMTSTGTADGWSGGRVAPAPGSVVGWVRGCVDGCEAGRIVPADAGALAIADDAGSSDWSAGAVAGCVCAGRPRGGAAGWRAAAPDGRAAGECEGRPPNRASAPRTITHCQP